MPSVAGEIACQECRRFVETFVGVVNGPSRGNGRRTDYRPYRLGNRGEAIAVPDRFFSDVVGECDRWLDHLSEIEVTTTRRLDHLERLPGWVLAAFKPLAGKRIGPAMSMDLAAKLLDVSRAKVYAAIGEGGGAKLSQGERLGRREG